MGHGMVIVLSFFLTAAASAATPTNEPTPPLYPEKWETKQMACEYSGGKLLKTFYRQGVPRSMKYVLTIERNGILVEQIEVVHTQVQSTYTRSVRNSPEKNWLEYSPFENEASDARLLAELETTKEQLLLACAK